ncbi:MAG: peptide-binding protein [Comamonadaceae bacterium]|nr:MAG: peptide-binding protein [Comamonadaceae bacterium]
MQFLPNRSLTSLFRNGLAAAALLAASIASAQQMVSVAGKEANLRAGAGNRHAVEWSLTKGYPLRVVGRKGNWLQVRDFENDKGWIYRPLTNSTPHYIVKSGTANLRGAPAARGRIVGKLTHGEVLRTLSKRGDWVQVQRESGTRGWVAKRLVWGW